MSRLIDADALMKTLGITDMDCHKCAWADKPRTICKRGSDFEDACIAIENAPTIEERKKGKWIHDGYDIPHGVDWMHCSVCGRREPHVPAAMTNFCPNCGADMRGEGNG